MKRLFLLSFSLFCVHVGIFAQHLDTITQQSHPQYYYDWWRDTIATSGACIQNGDTVYWELQYDYWWPQASWMTDNTLEIAQRMNTAQPLDVDGIAACGTYMGIPDCMCADVSTTNTDEYLRLYEIRGDSLILIGERPFNINRDTAHLFHPTDPGSGYGRSFPVYEVYFDSTATVTDSFYVGGTSQYHYRDPENNYLFPKRPIGYVAVVENIVGKVSYLHFRPTHLKTKRQDIPGVWIDSESKWYYFIWPILHEDPLPPSCDPVTGINASSAGSTLFLTWTGLPCHSRWQVAYTTTQGHPEQGTVEDVNYAYWQHNFTSDGTYFVYVRGYCAEDTLWSDWSDSIVFQVGSGSVDGIQPVSVLESQTQVYPNPANDRVSITCGYTLRRVELCSMSGQQLLSAEAGGHAATIDLGTLAPGTYMLVIHTSQGTVAKRLVVGR